MSLAPVTSGESSSELIPYFFSSILSSAALFSPSVTALAKFDGASLAGKACEFITSSGSVVSSKPSCVYYGYGVVKSFLII